MRRRKTGVGVILLLSTILLIGCAKKQEMSNSDGADTKEIAVDEEIGQDISYQGRVDLAYARQFAIDRYSDDYLLLTISDGSRFLIADEGKEQPKNLDKDIIFIQGDIKNTYLVATAAMDMFVHLDALDHIALSGTDSDGWYIEEAKQALENGSIGYAGKYNAPDYERILDAGCDLAVESTMILHNPEVKEKLESFGIPVLVDHASYETHPLGRMEWIKAYGVLTHKLDDAIEIFQNEVDALTSTMKQSNDTLTEELPTVAFFYITSTGAVSVRKSNDYVPKMIAMAGGRYIFDDISEDDTHSSSTMMQMEEFYAKAKDADYLIYNSAIDNELTSVEDLLAKSNLFADFRAVKEGKIWCASKNLYQESMSTAAFILDLNNMLSDEESGKMQYLHHIQ